MSRRRSARSTSNLALRSQRSNETEVFPETELQPTDKLVLNIFSLRVSDLDLRNYTIKVTFLDQLLVHAVIKSIGARDEEPTKSIVTGTMTFDPSDYEKMCLFVDSALVAQIEPLRSIVKNRSGVLNPEQSILIMEERPMDVSCCNVDIMPIFTYMKDTQKICVKKRMEPMILPSALKRKSWDTLPLLTMELTVERNPLNHAHHKFLKNANWIKLTLIASYNMIIPFENDYVYTAASKIPSQSVGDSTGDLITYSQGYKEPRGFNCTKFFPKWESLRGSGAVFTQGDQKLEFPLEDIQNEYLIDLPYYLNGKEPDRTVVWGSFHRSLMLNSDKWLWSHLRQYKWPLELHMYGEKNEGFSFMAFLDLCQILYPGEQTIRLAVPLQWINAGAMMRECDCQLLLTPNDSQYNNYEKPGTPILSVLGRGSKTSRLRDTSGTSASTSTKGLSGFTGANDKDAFVLVEIQIGRCLKPVIKPPNILQEDITAMLTKMELEAPRKRICTGRGQLEHEWQKTVRNAANSLRKVPYYGATEFCTFNRQLSETRTRVELTTSCWQDAAIFVNNHFVVQPYLQSDETFEELVMMSHACLMKSASNTLIRTDHLAVEVEPEVCAARHARQMQDINHAMDIFFRLIVEKPRNADYWRELSTCMKDIDVESAKVCLNKAVFLNPRHPLSLLSKGAMLFEEDPLIAEPFFIALLTFHPAWTSVWVITSVYFYERELFHLAEVIISFTEKWRNLRCPEDVKFLRSWEKELGDWWDSTPILPDMCLYYDAADLLLRLRALPLAEVCLSRVLSEAGDSPQYYHMISLCCRLRGDLENALCHVNFGLKKYGEINYLRCLEAEIQHKLGNFKQASESYAKTDTAAESFTALMSLSSVHNPRAHAILIDRVRTRPSAYAWAALAEDWLANPPPGRTVLIKTSRKRVDEEGAGDEETRETNRYMKAKASAIACAIQALKIDRQAGRAWAILGKLVRPKSKRLFCLTMARLSGWPETQEDIDKAKIPTQFSICHFDGTALRECRCDMCDKTHV